MIILAIVLIFLTIYLCMNIAMSLENRDFNTISRRYIEEQDKNLRGNTCIKCNFHVPHVSVYFWTPVFIKSKYITHHNFCSNCGNIWTFTERYDYKLGKPIKED